MRHRSAFPSRRSPSPMTRAPALASPSPVLSPARCFRARRRRHLSQTRHRAPGSGDSRAPSWAPLTPGSIPGTQQLAQLRGTPDARSTWQTLMPAKLAYSHPTFKPATCEQPDGGTKLSTAAEPAVQKLPRKKPERGQSRVRVGSESGQSGVRVGSEWGQSGVRHVSGTYQARVRHVPDPVLALAEVEGDGGGDFVRDRGLLGKVEEIGVVSVGPDVRLVADANEVSDDSHAVSVALHLPEHQVLGAERLAHPLHIRRAEAEREAGGIPDDAQSV